MEARLDKNDPSQEQTLLNIADSPKEAADKIINFILEVESNIRATDSPAEREKQHKRDFENHRTKIQLIFYKLIDKYKKTYFNNFFLRKVEEIIYWWTRKRFEFINEIKDRLDNKKEMNNSLQILELVCDFLKSGELYETSANTHLLELFLAELPEYQALNEDKSYTYSESTDAIKYKLATLQLVLMKFLTQAPKHIAKLKAETENPSVAVEKEKNIEKPKPILPPQHVDVYHSDPIYQPPPRKSLDLNNFTTVIATLEKKAKKMQAGVVGSDTKTPKKLNEDSIAETKPKKNSIKDKYPEAYANLLSFYSNRNNLPENKAREIEMEVEGTSLKL